MPRLLAVLRQGSLLRQWGAVCFPWVRRESRQGRQKTTFKSNVVRDLKKDIARMMPFLEAKQASGSPNVALREQAKVGASVARHAAAAAPDKGRDGERRAIRHQDCLYAVRAAGPCACRYDSAAGGTDAGR